MPKVQKSGVQRILIRDGIVNELKRKDGVVARIVELFDDNVFRAALIIKLKDYLKDFSRAKSHDELVECLAGMLEVIMVLTQLLGTSLRELHSVRRRKLRNKGGFKGRKFVTINKEENDAEF